MASIKFLRQFHAYVKTEGTEVGDCIYYQLTDKLMAKAYCADTSISVTIINRLDGEIDQVQFPFENYFTPKQCSPSSPKWHQHIDNGKWYFANYPHCLPTPDDYKAIATAMEKYFDLFR